MNKFQWNTLIFIVSMLLIGTGLLPGDGRSAIQNLKEEIRNGNIMNAAEFTDRVDTVVENNLYYHDMLLNINSAKENLLGTRVVKKPDTLVVKADSGKLVGYIQENPSTDEYAKELAAYIGKLKQFAEENGAAFLCGLVPVKGVYETLPSNVKDYSKENYEKSRMILAEQGIPFVDFRSVFLEKGLPEEELFFITDHHWKPHSGFAAYQAICEMLQERYGFDYNKEYADIRNFTIRTYPDWFLGSLGKKTGLYYTWSGADDFDLITPMFPTSFMEEVPQISRIREGSFIDTLLFRENLEKDYYDRNTYVTYSGGDYRLQIIKNKLLPDGPRIVVIRSSFACVVTPFLALQAKELYVVDDREGDYPEGDAVDLEQLITELHPDYVIVIKQL